MKHSEVFRARGRILTGRYPSRSIEITRECPLRCPGCYAYEPEHLVVSVDGLQPDQDERRKPAAYERILRNIAGQRITVHCTITRQQTLRPGYFEEFLEFWSARPEVEKVWFSLFTPQAGAHDPEVIPREERPAMLAHLSQLRAAYPKLVMPGQVASGHLNPPQSPDECIFARTTLSLTADLKNRIKPCQFGGTPDCTQCGCIASAGLEAVGDYRLFGFVPLRPLYDASDAVGRRVGKMFGPA